MGKWLKQPRRGRRTSSSSEGSPVMSQSFGGDPMKIAIAEERAYTRRRERQFEDAIDALKREAHRRGR